MKVSAIHGAIGGVAVAGVAGFVLINVRVNHATKLASLAKNGRYPSVSPLVTNTYSSDLASPDLIRPGCYPPGFFGDNFDNPYGHKYTVQPYPALNTGHSGWRIGL
jgi:hypothetical protein